MPGPTALLVVHGIGEQKPGETLAKLVKGLSTVAPDLTGGEARDPASATICGQPIRFYEVHWADLLQGEVMRGAFLMNELQSLSWFPWFNQRRGNYPRGRYSFFKLAFWCLVLPVVNFLVLFTYYGVSLLSKVIAPAREATATRRGRGVRSRIESAAREGTAPSRFDDLLDEYLGDVFAYVGSAARAFYREKSEPQVPAGLRDVFPRIMHRFNEQLVAARRDGCESIQIVAHSLGTVVAYHALTGFANHLPSGQEDDLRAARARVTRLYTIGSPLEKIRFFWPRLTPAPASSRDLKLRWDNFVSFFDPVAGALRSFDDFGPVTNHRLLGGGFLLGHVVYERSAVFLGVVSEGLCGRRLSRQRTFMDAVRSSIVLLGETLLAPMALAITLSLGAALFAAAAALLPFLLSLLVRPVLPPKVWAPVTDAATGVMLGVMALAFFVAPAVRASKVHARYWQASRPAEPSTSEVAGASG